MCSPPHTHTWVFIPDVRVHVEPVIQGDQLEEGETCLCKVTESTRVYFAIQTPTNNGKHILMS